MGCGGYLLKRTGDNNKLYYSISEVAKMTDTMAYVLRLWEKEFPSLKPKKNRGGNRIYQQKEIDLINHIKKLLYNDGYTIEGARQKLKSLKGSNSRLDFAEPSSNGDGELKAKIREIKKGLKDLQKLFA